MKKTLFGGFGLGVLVVAAFLAMNSLFTVDETEQVLVLQFGDHKRTITEPGLNFKLPFLQQRIVYDNRVLNLDPAVRNFLLADQKPVDIDYYVRYRIQDPLEYYQKVQTEFAARDLLEKKVNSQLREVLGQKLLEDILSDERTEILRVVTEKSREDAVDLGIEIVDVRIGKADLPKEISQNVFKRMQTERQEEAFEFRAQGRKALLEIKAEADREVEVMLAKARRTAEILRGEGQAARTRTLNLAHGKNLEFYNFLRSLESYEKSLTKDSEPMILTTDHPYLKQFSNFSNSQ